jgi:hypothetical protein
LLDVDGIAEIPADIFAETLHGKIFIQMRERANLFSEPQNRNPQMTQIFAERFLMCVHLRHLRIPHVCVAQHTKFRFALTTGLP